MNIAIIFAGGVGTRMRTVDIPKQFLRVHGKTIIVRTVEAFEEMYGVRVLQRIIAESAIYAPEAKLWLNIDAVKALGWSPAIGLRELIEHVGAWFRSDEVKHNWPNQNLSE